MFSKIGDYCHYISVKKILLYLSISNIYYTLKTYIWFGDFNQNLCKVNNVLEGGDFNP